MGSQRLASININRHITHEAGKLVYIHWDNRQFCLVRSSFAHLVRALEHGSQRLYAEADGHTVVQVDDNLREVWIENECLALNGREYRALLNAALTTETRLHGFRVRESSTESIKHHLPRPTYLYWN